jgi:predicted RNA-binding Zn ribbon-like protein
MSESVEPIPVSGQAGTLELIAGMLCLDFVNTLEPRIVTDDGTIPHNYLTSYEELIAWGQHTEIVNPSQAQQLLQASNQHPEQVQAALAQAITLRETIYAVFAAIAQHREVPVEALDRLHSFYSQAISHGRLQPEGDSFQLIWTLESLDFQLPLWPVAASAVELLLNGERQRMKQCPIDGEGCGWLFYDTSKNNSRRWCSMRTCGMQSKDRRRGKRLRSPQKPKQRL